MSSANKQHKRSQRAKAKAKQNRTKRAAAPNDFLDPNDERIDLETVDLTELFQLMSAAEKVSQKAMCEAFLAHPCWRWYWSRKVRKKRPTSSLPH